MRKSQQQHSGNTVVWQSAPSASLHSLFQGPDFEHLMVLENRRRQLAQHRSLLEKRMEMRITEESHLARFRLSQMKRQLRQLQMTEDARRKRNEELMNDAVSASDRLLMIRETSGTTSARQLQSAQAQYEHLISAQAPEWEKQERQKKMEQVQQIESEIKDAQLRHAQLQEALEDDQRVSTLIQSKKQELLKAKEQVRREEMQREIQKQVLEETERAVEKAAIASAEELVLKFKQDSLQKAAEISKSKMEQVQQDLSKMYSSMDESVLQQIVQQVVQKSQPKQVAQSQSPPPPQAATQPTLEKEELMQQLKAQQAMIESMLKQQQEMKDVFVQQQQQQQQQQQRAAADSSSSPSPMTRPSSAPASSSSSATRPPLPSASSIIAASTAVAASQPSITPASVPKIALSDIKTGNHSNNMASPPINSSYSSAPYSDRGFDSHRSISSSVADADDDINETPRSSNRAISVPSAHSSSSAPAPAASSLSSLSFVQPSSISASAPPSQSKPLSSSTASSPPLKDQQSTSPVPVAVSAEVPVAVSEEKKKKSFFSRLLSGGNSKDKEKKAAEKAEKQKKKEEEAAEKERRKSQDKIMSSAAASPPVPAAAAPVSTSASRIASFTSLYSSDALRKLLGSEMATSKILAAARSLSSFIESQLQSTATRLVSSKSSPSPASSFIIPYSVASEKQVLSLNLATSVQERKEIIKLSAMDAAPSSPSASSSDMSIRAQSFCDLLAYHPQGLMSFSVYKSVVSQPTVDRVLLRKAVGSPALFELWEIVIRHAKFMATLAHITGRNQKPIDICRALAEAICVNENLELEKSAFPPTLSSSSSPVLTPSSSSSSASSFFKKSSSSSSSSSASPTPTSDADLRLYATDVLASYLAAFVEKDEIPSELQALVAAQQLSGQQQKSPLHLEDNDDDDSEPSVTPRAVSSVSMLYPSKNMPASSANAAPVVPALAVQQRSAIGPSPSSTPRDAVPSGQSSPVRSSQQQQQQSSNSGSSSDRSAFLRSVLEQASSSSSSSAAASKKPGAADMYGPPLSARSSASSSSTPRGVEMGYNPPVQSAAAASASSSSARSTPRGSQPAASQSSAPLSARGSSAANPMYNSNSTKPKQSQAQSEQPVNEAPAGFSMAFLDSPPKEAKQQQQSAPSYSQQQQPKPQPQQQQYSLPEKQPQQSAYGIAANRASSATRKYGKPMDDDFDDDSSSQPAAPASARASAPVAHQSALARRTAMMDDDDFDY